MKKNVNPFTLLICVLIGAFPAVMILIFYWLSAVVHIGLYFFIYKQHKQKSEALLFLNSFTEFVVFVVFNVLCVISFYIVRVNESGVDVLGVSMFLIVSFFYSMYLEQNYKIEF